ncbi:hypothetical protein ACVI55_002332 [Sinorhizobium medicae]
MSDRFMKHDAGPAGGKYDVHGARRRVDRLQIDKRLPQCLVGSAFPAVLGDELTEAAPPADAEGSAFLPVALADHDGDVDPRHRPHVVDAVSIGSQNIHDLPARSDRRGYLPDLGLLGAQIGIDLLEQLHLGLETWLADRISVSVKLLVGALRRCRIGAGIATRHLLHRVRSPLQGSERQLAGMRVADSLAGDGAQAEALVGVETAALQAAIVEGEHLRLRMFEEEFAVIGAGKRVGENLADRRLVRIEEADQIGIHGSAPCREGLGRETYWLHLGRAGRQAKKKHTTGNRSGKGSVPAFEQFDLLDAGKTGNPIEFGHQLFHSAR